jgi:hypothetical protein
MDYTDSSGTPGDATINKPSGRSAITRNSDYVTITNSLVTTNSRIFIALVDYNGSEANGDYGNHYSVEPGAGHFHVISRDSGGARRTTSSDKVVFNWFVIN